VVDWKDGRMGDGRVEGWKKGRAEIWLFLYPVNPCNLENPDMDDGGGMG
jgi:hypothetical protein